MRQRFYSSVVSSCKSNRQYVKDSCLCFWELLSTSSLESPVKFVLCHKVLFCNICTDYLYYSLNLVQSSHRESSSKRNIAPLRDIEELNARDFAGFATAYPSPQNTSRYCNLRTYSDHSSFSIHPRILTATTIFSWQLYCSDNKHVFTSVPMFKFKPGAAVQAIEME